MINQEFSKIPQDIRRSIVKGQLLFEKGKDFPSLGSIHIRLFKVHNLLGRRPELGSRRHDFLGPPRFLSSKLIARKGQYLETL